MVDGARGAGRRRRRPDAADQVRGVEGAEDRPEAHRRRSTRSTAPMRAPQEVRQRGVRPVRALDATDEQLDFPILYGSAKEGWMADKPRGPEGRRMPPLFDLVLSHVAPPHVEDGAVPPARRRSSRPIPISAASSPAASPRARSRRTSRSRCSTIDGKLVEQGRVSKVLAFRGLERVARRRGERRRHRRDRRPAQGDRGRHHLRARGHRAAAGPADRSADAVHDLPRQRFAARRHRRRPR